MNPIKSTLTAIALVASLGMSACAVSDSPDQARCLYHRYGLLGAGLHPNEPCDPLEEAAEESLRPPQQPLFPPRQQEQSSTWSCIGLGDRMSSCNDQYGRRATCQNWGGGYSTCQ